MAVCQLTEDDIDSGRENQLVDPDPDRIYSKRKQRRGKTQDVKLDNQPSLKYPTNGWSDDLSRMPSFTRAEVRAHISQSTLIQILKTIQY